MDNQELNCFCGDQSREDQCMIDCNALHILHYSCLKNYIDSGKKQCPFDRKPISRCLHNEEIKNLPNPPPPQPQQSQIGDYPCYICHSSTRPGLDIDQVVVCSRCDSVYCHPTCVERITHQNFDMSYQWFCPDCQIIRSQRRNRRRRRV